MNAFYKCDFRHSCLRIFLKKVNILEIFGLPLKMRLTHPTERREDCMDENSLKTYMMRLLHRVGLIFCTLLVELEFGVPEQKKTKISW